MCTIYYVEKTDSTNSLMANHYTKLDHGTVMAAHEQTAGRGQRGNSWESEPRKNLTFSLLLKPKTIIASHQFELLQIIAIAITNVLREQLKSDEVYIKWPNDIYYRDKKLVGILIENTLSDHTIERSIIGIGINVNQEVFVSDAPNPISMTNITGETYELDPLLETISRRIVSDFDAYEANPAATQLAARYRFMLWRGEGYWPYHDNTTGDDFMGRIAAIAPSGHLTLETRDGIFRTYAFKEVAAILK